MESFINKKPKFLLPLGNNQEHELVQDPVVVNVSSFLSYFERLMLALTSKVLMSSYNDQLFLIKKCHYQAQKVFYLYDNVCNFFNTFTDKMLKDYFLTRTCMYCNAMIKTMISHSSCILYK